MNRNLSGLASAVAVASVLLTGASAFAQTDSRTSTVTERPRPELDAIGVKRGGFTIFPSLDVKETYNDNIFATETGTIDDFVTTVTPGVSLQSDWNSHFLGFDASGDIVRYSSNTAENVEKYRLSTVGRLDIQRDIEASAGLSYETDTEERGSVNDVSGIEPTDFNVVTLDAGFFNAWNRVALNADGKVKRHDFDDSPTSGVAINNDDRDRDEFTLDVRAGYEIVPEYEAFANIILTSINYDSAVDDNGVNRDNEGFEIRAGARVDISALIFGDIFAGYLQRDYEASTLKSVETFVAGIDMTWNVTPLTTVKGGFSRDVSETTLASASGTLSTALDASVDHELLRNLILSARVGVSSDEFEGTTREDDYIKGGVTVSYLLNRYFSVTLDFDHAQRDSNVSGSDNEINKFFLKLRAQL